MVKFLTPEQEKAVIEAIRNAEKNTSGEIRVHLSKKPSQNALQEAKKTFKKLGMSRTRLRNAVLIFVAPKSRDFAIVGDEGIHRRVGDEFWSQTRDLMLSYFSKNLFAEGIVAGVLSVGEKLKADFPAQDKNPNELPDTPTED